MTERRGYRGDVSEAENKMAEPQEDIQESARSPREFLRKREALVVHFSSPTSRQDFGFPEDLQKAIELGTSGAALSFSTIIAGDRGPTQVRPVDKANATGSVGIVVDIAETGSVQAVGALDAGSTEYSDQFMKDKGITPSVADCARSLDERGKSPDHPHYNEWRVRNFQAVGIFIFEPVQARVTKTRLDLPDHLGGSTDEWNIDNVALDEILSAFPTLRIFRSNSNGFEEWNRPARDWRSVKYDQIVPP